MRQEKATGLLTSLEAESPEQKEKHINGLVKASVPLPQPKSASEKYPINKIRRSGLPPQPKTPSPLRQPSRITASPALPPEGSPNLYEKSEKVKKERKGPAGECFCGLLTPESERLTEKKASKVRIPSEKIRKAKAAGLLTPLKEKSAAEKEKILKGLAMQGLPLPAAKTASERNLVNKVRKELGLPPEPKTASEKKRYEKAIALCVIVPLENMPPSIKEKTLRAQVELGFQLPEGRTASEKALITKVMNESKTVSKVSIEKWGKSKAVGLLTPLEGKTSAEKEKIVRGLVEAGMPLPEGTTSPEKLMMHRVRTEPKIPPVKTISEKELIRDRKTEVFLTPLAKKSSEQNDKIQKGLDATGLLMPEEKTASEKELIKKTRTAADLPTEATPSEKKGILKSKLKIISLRSTREIAAKSSKVEGISEEYEDISKTTTCDRCCGCDRKKIRFQHSYVKIKPTSPSISSHCYLCPDESIPCVKGGIHPDNKGIKVTIKSADRVPRYYTEFAPYSPTIEEKVFTMECDNKPIDSSPFVSNSKSTVHTKIRNKRTPKKLCKNGVEYIFQYDTRHPSSDESLGKITSQAGSRNSVIYIYNSMLQSDYNYWMNESNALLETISNEALVHKRPELVSGSSNDCTKAFSQCSLNSSLIKKSETLTTSSLCDSIQIISVLSFADSELTSNSSHYLCYAASENYNSSNAAVQESDYFADTDNMIRKGYLNKSNSNTDRRLTHVNKHHTRNQIHTMSESKFKIDDVLEKLEPVVLINDMNSDQDIMTVMDELLANQEFSGASSIYVVLPSSSDSESETNDPSALCLRVSERKLKLSNSLDRRQRMSSIACALKISKTPKRNNYESYASPKFCKPDVICPLETSHTINENIKKLQETTEKKQSDVNRPHKTTQTDQTEANTPKETLQINLENRLQLLHKNTTSQQEQTLHEKKNIHKLYQTILHKNKNKYKQNIVTTDTSQDRPCFCPPGERGLIHVLPNYSETNQCVASVVSELITPMTMKQGISLDIPTRDLSFSTQTSLSKHNYHIPDTPVIMCRIPACVVTEGRSNDGHTRQLATSTPCPPGQWQFLPTLDSGQQISVGCGASYSKLGVSLPVVTPKNNSTECNRCSTLEYDIENIYLTPCGSLEIKIESTCGTHCSNLEPKIEKASIGNKKKAKLKTLCECDPPDPPLCYCAPGAKKVKRSIGYQCCRCADAQNGTEQPITSDANLSTNEKNNITHEKCVCNNKSVKKNKVICECPESEIDYITYADSETDMKMKWKMQSELTQTTSGFKLDVKKKQDVDCAMSFKDALAYHASLDIDAVDVNNNECCPCEVVARKIKKKATCECECLEEALECEPISKEPFNGIKLTITRKGPASKDLNDVCCFNMQTHESNTYMVAYFDEY